MKLRPANPTGQILIVMTLAIVALIGTATLSADVCIFYYNWISLQAAADGAALAGASCLPADGLTAQSTANRFARSNGMQAAEITSTQVAADAKSITVTLQRKVSYLFGQMLGLTAGVVSARATAVVETASFTMATAPPGQVRVRVASAFAPDNRARKAKLLQ